MPTELTSSPEQQGADPARPGEPTPSNPGLVEYLHTLGKDASRLIFDDELTGIRNRRFMLRYLENEVRWEDANLVFSLLVIDLDQFKGVNDTYGHAVGDAFLSWLATLLTEAAGETGIPVRYGGDEFVLLLPGADHAEALRVGNMLLQRTVDRRFRVRGTEQVFQVGVSIGVACAPEDGRNGKDLFHAGDTALYHAKQSGRGQLADAADIDHSKVFSRTALHRLKATGISGRQNELAVVSGALEGLSAGRSAFITVDAGPGLGKTAFLDTIANNLADSEAFRLVKVAGVPQEGYRSYYLATSILLELLRERQFEGGLDLHDLSGLEIASLAHLVPQLGGDETQERDLDEGDARAAIFVTLTQCIPRLADSRPLVVLIDDLQFADEATLYLLGALLRNALVDLLVCGTYMESVERRDDDAAPPLGRFLSTYGRELGMQRLKLTPLDHTAIGEHLHGVFPNLRMPQGFDRDLEQVTLGNPLFITEIIRKLVREQKAMLVGQEWIIEPLPEGYLPQTLEEVVGEMITALDEESRALLEQASALGEDVSVSVLAGSSEVDENRVLEFLDRAESLGLIELDFQVNDEIMRFLGKRVMEISYGAIDEDRRKELHERVANYQEGLFRDQLAPSASLLAYHFKRSANQEKARRYQRIQQAYGQTVFHASEAAGYIAGLADAGLTPGDPLDDASLGRVPDVLRSLLTAVRSVQLYPKDSDAVAGTGLQLTRAIEEILPQTERFTLTYSQDGGLEVNGEVIDFAAAAGIANAFAELLRRSRLQGIAFFGRVDGDEILDFVHTLAALSPGNVAPGYWRRYAEERGVQTLELKQTSYARVALENSGTESGELLGGAGDEELGPEDMTALPDILRTFTRTAKNVKLYPVHSASAGSCMQEFREALAPVLARRSIISLSRTEDSLLANGAVVSVADYELLASSFLDLMSSLGLSSIALLSGTPQSEIELLFEAIREVPNTGPEPDFWQRFTAEKGLSGIRVNHEYYSLVTSAAHYVAPLGTADEVASQPAGALPAAGGAAFGAPVMSGEVYVEPGEAPPGHTGREYYGTESPAGTGESMEGLGRELLLEGQDDLFRELIQKVFEGFRERDDVARRETMSALSNLLRGLVGGLQHKFTTLAGVAVVEALADEDNPGVLEQGVSLVHAMATAALQLSDARTAGGLYEALASCATGLDGSPDSQGVSLRQILLRPPDDTARKILQSDLSSEEPSRQASAALALNGLGAAGIPLLIETIKQGKDLRVRQAAANVLAGMGAEAAEQIRRALIVEVIVEQRFHILEVIETVTLDLQDELSICLGDSNPKIRRAAFRLAERLNHEGLVEVLEPLARDADAAVAKGALRSLASLGTDEAIHALVSVLDATKDPEVAVACCQALGQVGGAAAVAALSRVMGRKKFLSLSFAWGDQVRATAAMVLSSLSEPSARAALQRFANDRDPRIRRVAGGAISTAE